nr:ABC transporter permease [Bacillota bacterium]
MSYALLAGTIGVNASLQPYFFTLYNIQSNLNTFVPLVAAAV